MKNLARTFRMRASFAGLAAAVVAVLAPAQAAQPAGVEAVRPWSRPAAAGTTGVGFLTLVNNGKAPVVLTGVETPFARKVEIHRSAMQGGVMSMKAQAAVTIPAGGAVRFEPSGLHLMLLGLKQPLKTGGKVPATLVFADGRRLETVFSVSVAAPKAAEHAAPMDHAGH